MPGNRYGILDMTKWGKLVVNQFRLFNQVYNFGKFIYQKEGLKIKF